jgi:hypothetical protein
MVYYTQLMKKFQATTILFVSIMLHSCASHKKHNNPIVRSTKLEFKNFDKDKNNKIDHDEYISQLLHWAQAQDINDDDILDFSNELVGGHAWMISADKSKNGKVSIYELLKAADIEFKKNDQNKSSDLSIKEFKD